MTLLLPAGPDAISQAVRFLAAGRLVAFPTETVYGLGADATDARATAEIFAAKGRPSFNPLIAHVPDLAAARMEGDFGGDALALAQAFWPGPLTLVVPARADGTVSELARAGLPNVGLRVPSHPLAQALLRAFGRPVAAPSANRSGHVSPTLARHVADDLGGQVAAILDGGATPVGLESTVVGCLAGRVLLLRPGSITRADIARVLGMEPEDADAGNRPLAPGQLTAHYAPTTPMRLGATSVEPGEAVLNFGAALPGSDIAAAAGNLSVRSDMTEAAANLYRLLRELDSAGATCIAVAPVPGTGIGEAIADRLFRAAAGSGNRSERAR